MITVVHSISNNRATLGGYSLTRGQQDPATGLSQYTLAIDGIVPAAATVEIIYCHHGEMGADQNQAIGQIVSTTSPSSLAQQNNAETETLQSLRQRLLPIKAEYRRPIELAQEERPCIYGPTGQYSDPQGQDYNQPLAIINLRHATAADRQGGLTTTLALASSDLQDTISAIQTAEGAASEIFEMTIRIKECLTIILSSIQSATYNSQNASDICDEIENLCQEIGRVCDQILYNDIPVLNRQYDIIVPITYGTQIVDDDLLRIPAAWGGTDGEIRIALRHIAETLRQTIDNGSMTDTDRQQAVENQIMPAIDEALLLVEGQRWHLGALYNTCEHLVSLCDTMADFHDFPADTYARPAYWARRRAIIEDAAAAIIQRQRELLHNYTNTTIDQEKSLIAIEMSRLARLHHLVSNWHQQFNLES